MSSKHIELCQCFCGPSSKVREPGLAGSHVVGSECSIRSTSSQKQTALGRFHMCGVENREIPLATTAWKKEQKHTGRLTWNLKMNLWKTVFLYNPVVFRLCGSLPERRPVYRRGQGEITQPVGFSVRFRLLQQPCLLASRKHLPSVPSTQRKRDILRREPQKQVQFCMHLPSEVRTETPG